MPKQPDTQHAAGRSGQVRLILWLLIAVLGVQLPAARGSMIDFGDACLPANDSAEESSSCCCEIDASFPTSGCPMPGSGSPSPSQPEDDGEPCSCSFTPEVPLQLPFADCAPIGVTGAKELGRLLDSLQHIAMNSLAVEGTSASPGSLDEPPDTATSSGHDLRHGSLAGTRLQQGGLSRLLSELSALLI